MVDTPGNSHKEKDESPLNKDPKKKPDPKPEVMEKVVTGEVIKQKTPIFTKFKNTFFGGDLNTLARYISYEVLVPAVRNLVVDAFTKGVERAIYGETQHRRRPNIGGPKFQYDTPFRRDTRNVGHLPDQPPHYPRGQRSYDIGRILIGSKEEADLVIERMVDIIDTYGVVTAADLYQILGLNFNYVDNKWGWTQLKYAEAHQTRDGYLLDLPEAQALSN